ncbi:MAG: response regulator, partial [Planctomycetales bacterium]|nr:response regulator [Planctomycetales bacterium]
MNLTVPSLLITDDDRDFRETLQSIFEPRGFRTLLAEDGDVAVEMVGKEQIHVMLVDMHMPRLTGLDVLRFVHERAVPIPSILMSAALDAQIEAEARQAAAFSVVSKPFRLQQITTLVSQAMRQ